MEEAGNLAMVRASIQRDTWSGTAFVTNEGTICSALDDRGTRLLSHYAQLADYARAFLRAERPTMAALWLAPSGEWYSVSLSRTVDSSGTAEATIELARTDRPYGLTARELDVLTLVSGGLSNGEIAHRLATSARTVSTQVERVLRKLHQQTRAGAAALAVEQGLLRIPVPGGGQSLGSLTVGVVDQLACGPVPSRRPTPPPRSPPIRRLRPLQIGSLIPDVGLGAADGREFAQGTALAVAEVNGRGGIAGRAVEHRTVGVDITSIASITSGLDTLIETDVDALTCGYVLVGPEPALRIAAAYGCPFLHSMTAESVTAYVANDAHALASIFHVCPTEAPYGVGFIRTLDGLEAAGWRPENRQLAFAETSALGGRAVTKATIEAAERSSWEVDRVFTVTIADADWSEVIGYLGRTTPAAILVDHAVAAEAARFQRRFAECPTDTLIQTVYAPSTPEYLEAAGSSAEGVLWSTVAGVYDDVLGRAFGDRYAAHWGAPAGRSLAGIGYDQVYLLAHAWSRVGNQRDFRAVCEELRRGVFRGVVGGYYFANPEQRGLAYPDDTPDPSLGQAHLVYQIQQGRHRPLAPSPYADSRFVRPPWFERRFNEPQPA